MSEHIAPRERNHEQVVDQLLADSGLDATDDVRTELLELRALAGTAPLPSEAVRALMVARPATVTRRITTADAGSAVSGTPTVVLTAVARTGTSTDGDELAARRRRKRRGVIAGLAVAVSLAGGASAAAASVGGIPAAFEHLGAAIGSVVSRFTPASGGSPQQGTPAGTTPDPRPASEEPQPAPVSGQHGTVPATPNTPSGTVPDTQPTPGGGVPHELPKVPSNLDPGNISVPTPPVAPPVAPPNIVPPKVGQPEIPVPPGPNIPEIPEVPAH